MRRNMRSRMNRRTFLGAAGAGAAGLVGAAMMGSSVASAEPVNGDVSIWQGIQVGFLYHGNNSWGPVGEPCFRQAIDEVNAKFQAEGWMAVNYNGNIYDIYVGTSPANCECFNLKNPNAPCPDGLVDCCPDLSCFENTTTLTNIMTNGLVCRGAAYIGGAVGSSDGEKLQAVTGNAKVVYGAAAASTNALDGLPYFFRTHADSESWGASGVEYALTYSEGQVPDYSKKTTLSFIIRPDAFGESLRDGVRDAWTSNGKTYVAEEYYTAISSGGTIDTFKTHIQNLMNQGVPDIVAGSWRSSEMRLFLEAWVEVEPEYSGMDQVLFIHTGSVRGDHSSLTPEAFALLTDRSVGVQPWFNENAEGYLAWDDAFNTWASPEDKGIVLDAFGYPKQRHALAVYDAAIIYFLALVKASMDKKKLVATTNDEVMVQIPYVSGGNGSVFYPGMFGEAVDAILAGQDINYEGASGSVDIGQDGNIVGALPYIAWKSIATSPYIEDIMVFDYGSM